MFFEHSENFSSALIFWKLDHMSVIRNRLTSADYIALEYMQMKLRIMWYDDFIQPYMLSGVMCPSY